LKADSQFDQILKAAIREREDLGLRRSRRSVRALDATHLELDGKRYINFSSNDYLGLSHHPAVIEAVCESARNDGVGSGAAGLISGYTKTHERCERAIADWKGTQAAALLASGYQANIAAVQTIQAVCEKRKGRGVRFLIDKLAHASLIDALRAAEASFRIFPHNHMAKLQRLLADAGESELQVVVTESIFSMDGDAADVQTLAQLQRDHNFILLLDEAHASGVYGARGSGYAAEHGLTKLADITVVTLSKALGLAGGAVCASQAFIDALTNFGRAWIYSTMIPPMLAAGVERAIQVIAEEPWRQERVRDLARRVRVELTAWNCKIPAGDSPIISLVLGDEGRTMAAAEKLGERGLFVVAVRPPTVPRGSSRLRITLSANHSDSEIQQLIDAMKLIPAIR